MKDKLILITGASSGIGEACARVFAKNGCRLILNARNQEKLCELKKELEEAYGTDILLIPFDVRNREEATRVVNSLPDDWKAIDVLINNAGLALGTDKEHQGDLDEFCTMIDTNVKGLLTMTRLLVPGMVERGHGHIINIGSVAGDAAYPGGAVYCATKAAVKVLSDGLRMDLYDTPIRVTNLKPGLVVPARAEVFGRVLYTVSASADAETSALVRSGREEVVISVCAFGRETGFSAPYPEYETETIASFTFDSGPFPVTVVKSRAYELVQSPVRDTETGTEKRARLEAQGKLSELIPAEAQINTVKTRIIKNGGRVTAVITATTTERIGIPIKEKWNRSDYSNQQ